MLKDMIPNIILGIISGHFPALQILIPFAGALLATLSFNRFAAWLIATISASLLLVLSIYANIVPTSDPTFYDFGNWPAQVGIEYRLDGLNRPIIIFINAVLLFFLLSGYRLISETITDYIEQGKQHLFYALLLFAHVGFLGVISTNDLFNIYVFIEISSLATYVLMSKGNSPRALIGAFDYLMIGTIGATLILISIGFLFALTGSLNITDIADILSKSDNFRIILVAITFFITGLILKMAFFPMHFWLIRAYSTTAPFLLTYFGGVSSLFGVYIFLRFMYFTANNEFVLSTLFLVLRPLALLTIIACSYLALRTQDFKKIIIYSSASQVGYIFLLITIDATLPLLFQLLIIDAINKIALFTIIAHIQNKTQDLNIATFPCIKDSLLFKVLCAFSFLFSAGLPITSMFLVKINILELLINRHLITEFIIATCGSSLALLYHLRLVRAIFLSANSNQVIKIETKLYGLAAIILIQMISLIYINDNRFIPKFINEGQISEIYESLDVCKQHHIHATHDHMFLA